MAVNFFNAFERDLYAKLLTKTGNKESEEATLVKTFKFFDVMETGLITFDQFQASLIKLGLHYEPQQFSAIFNHCDKDGSGSIDYKEFVCMFLGEQAASKGHVAPKMVNERTVKQLIDDLRKQIMRRGAKSIIGLQRVFKRCDDDESGQLSRGEFFKALKEYRMDITDQQLAQVFDLFDGDKSGSISFDEFLRVIKGDLNEFRQELVEAAFKKLDRDESGVIEVEDIIGKFSAKNHPAVMECRKTEEEVLEEFLSTFEQHHNNSKGQANDYKITKEEFIEYYTNVSASIDDDQYFAQMMNSSWNLNGDASQYRKYGKGWCSEGENGKNYGCFKQSNDEVKGKPTMFSGMMSCDNPFQNMTSYYSNQEPGGRPRPSMGNEHVSKPNNKSHYLRFTGSETDVGLDSHIPKNYDRYMKENKRPVDGAPLADNSATLKAQQSIDLQLLQSKVFVRGARGLIGLKKHFKLMDKDGSGNISIEELSEGLKNLKIDLKSERIENIFSTFDTDSSGSISIDEFIDGLIGPTSFLRHRLITKAFEALDKNGNGSLELEEIEDRFQGRRHPECLNGEKTADECKHEFMSLFKAHHNAETGFKGKTSVHLAEFMQYHKILSVFYPTDAEFKNFIIAIWNIDLKKVDPDFAGTKPEVHGKTSKEQWVKENCQSYYGNRLLDDGHAPNSMAQYNREMNPPAGQSAVQFQPRPSMKGGMRSKNQTSNGQETYKMRSPDEILGEVRKAVLARGTEGIIGLKRCFKQRDANNNNKLDLSEFLNAMSDYRIALDHESSNAVFQIFDQNKDGEINYEEFVQGIVGRMVQRREFVVKAAFRKIDSNGNGVLTTNEIKDRYNAGNHPEVVAGRLSEQDCLYKFLDTFDSYVVATKGNFRDKDITQNEFLEFYNCLSCSVKTDQEFELLVSSTWTLI